MKLKKPAAQFLRLLLCFSVAYVSATTKAGDIILKGLKSCGSGTIEVVKAGDAVTFTSDVTVQLADIKAPEYWPKGAPYKSWPYGFASKKALTKIANGQTVTLYCDKPAKNTFGDTIAHIQLSDGTWLQHLLVQEGHAFFYPNVAHTEISTALVNAENRARTEEVGLWASSLYRPLRATGSNLKSGWFQTVEGKIYSAKKIGKKIYLNFGQDWRKDFTIQLNGKLEKKYLKQGVTPLSLAGQNIEVRGWVEWSGGPKIILTHTDQMRLLTVR